MDPNIVAYGAIIAMAVFPIYFGSWQTLDRVVSSPDMPNKLTLSSRLGTRLDTEIFSSSEAYMFPLTGSAALLSLYIVFRYIGKEYINMLLGVYFAFIGVWVMTVLLSQIGLPIENYLALDKFEFLIKKSLHAKNLAAKKNGNEDNEDQKDIVSAESGTILSIPFTSMSFFAFILATVLTGVYTIWKNWILSNVFGLAFSIIGIRIMALDSFKTGMILLTGLFFYDIFWVFGTNVMVSVAVNLDAPIKLLFPRDIMAEKYSFAMLGLGDIVIPGVFLALCLRWDYHRHLLSLCRKTEKQTKINTKAKIHNSSAVSSTQKKHIAVSAVELSSLSFSKPYFNACLLAYICGLLLTIFIMHVFKAAQPALLYLSPACILSTLAVAIRYGQVSDLFSYSPDEDLKIKNLLVPESKKSIQKEESVLDLKDKEENKMLSKKNQDSYKSKSSENHFEKDDEINDYVEESDVQKKQTGKINNLNFKGKSSQSPPPENEFNSIKKSNRQESINSKKISTSPVNYSGNTAIYSDSSETGLVEFSQNSEEKESFNNIGDVSESKMILVVNRKSRKRRVQKE